MNELSNFQRDILYIVSSESEPIGREIKDELNEYYDNTITSGRLYPNLDKLVQFGYIDRYEVDGRTHAYTITEIGKEAISRHEDWKHDMLNR